MCQNNCWLCCFPQNVCELKKCDANCRNFFCVYGHLQMRRGENFQSKRHGGVGFPHSLYFWIGIVFNKEGISSASGAGIRLWDELFSGNGLFQC